MCLGQTRPCAKGPTPKDVRTSASRATALGVSATVGPCQSFSTPIRSDVTRFFSFFASRQSARAQSLVPLDFAGDDSF